MNQCKNAFFFVTIIPFIFASCTFKYSCKKVRYGYIESEMKETTNLFYL